MDNKTTIGSNIRSALEGKSTLAIARATGIPPRCIQRYRAGTRLPKPEQFPALAKYAQVDVASFFQGTES